MQRGQWLVAGLAVAVAVAAGAWYGSRPEAPPPLSVASRPGAAVAAATLTLHVSGEVVRPGLVELPPGARIADAVAAAGGATGAADLSALNLAAPLVDGGQVAVPAAGTSPAAGPGGAVSLSLATAAELQTLPGVGPVTANRIVAHREQHGPFSAVEDLLDVPGIGEGRLAALRDLVVP